MEERFWAKVDKTTPDGCWVWTRSCFSNGYGQFRVAMGESPRRAHRVSWEIHSGGIPDGLLVLHTCDNPPCVRPDHLFLGDDAANAADKVSKGRQSRVGSRGKLAPTQVQEIRQRASRGESMRSLGREFGVDGSNVSRLVNGLAYK